MSRFFSVDNKFFSTINKIVDMMWLSILWSLCSLPLLFLLFTFIVEQQIVLLLIVLLPIAFITIGPASAALYYAVVKSVRRDRSYATKCFFHAFKVNFKIGALSSMLVGLMTAILLLDIIWAPVTMPFDESMYPFIRGIFLGMGIVMIFILVWMYPLLSRFELKFKELIKNSMVLAVKNIFRTIIMAALWIGMGYCFYHFFEYIAYYLVMIPIIVPSVSALIRSFVIEPVFKRITGDPNEDSDTEVDAWYAE
ncbi:MAG: DUF624 domain-containing protein [Lachnospiraceae bacterium]|nr:DUF624 domain-containing protein [Lachnospiraceae bacterium]